jgi:hypothetical protein
LIKLVHCVRRLPDHSVAAFREAWEEFGERLREAAPAIGAFRVVLSTTLEIPLNDAIQLARGADDPFDGIVEIVWPSGAVVAGEIAEPQTRQLVAELRALQERFVDVGRSAFFFVHEQELHSSPR